MNNIQYRRCWFCARTSQHKCSESLSNLVCSLLHWSRVWMVACSLIESKLQFYLNTLPVCTVDHAIDCKYWINDACSPLKWSELFLESSSVPVLHFVVSIFCSSHFKLQDQTKRRYRTEPVRFSNYNLLMYIKNFHFIEAITFPRQYRRHLNAFSAKTEVK